MKATIVILLLLLAVLATYAYATATSETGDSRALPCTLYGKTSGGALKVILVDSAGIVQTTS